MGGWSSSTIATTCNLDMAHFMGGVMRGRAIVWGMAAVFGMGMGMGGAARAEDKPKHAAVTPAGREFAARQCQPMTPAEIVSEAQS